jgi:hypothetical protein
MFRIRSAATQLVALVAASLALAAPGVAHIAVLDPMPGETLQADSTYRVRWIIAIEHPTLGWDIAYSIDGPLGPWTEVVNDLPVGDPTMNSVHEYDWLVPHAPSQAVWVRVWQHNTGMSYYGYGGAIEIQSPCPAPVRFCAGAPNSNGTGAVLSHVGSLGVATADLGLRVDGAVPGALGILIYSRTHMPQTPFGDGFLCVDTSRFFRASPALLVAGNGARRFDLRFGSAPVGAGLGMILGDTTWHFQFWYQDANGPGGMGFNMSDALEIRFCP